jgi:hypothetical protein
MSFEYLCIYFLISFHKLRYVKEIKGKEFEFQKKNVVSIFVLCLGIDAGNWSILNLCASYSYRGTNSAKCPKG